MGFLHDDNDDDDDDNDDDDEDNDGDHVESTLRLSALSLKMRVLETVEKPGFFLNTDNLNVDEDDNDNDDEAAVDLQIQVSIHPGCGL